MDAPYYSQDLIATGLSPDLHQHVRTPFYSQDLAGAVSASTNMLAPETLAALAAELADDLIELADGRRTGASAVLSLPDKVEDIAEIEAAAARIGYGADTVAVLGTGGSSLGGQTLAALADCGVGPRPGRPRLVFFDNVDPTTFDAFFRTANPARTRFIAISKSGGTAETLLQTLTCLEWVESKLGANAAAKTFTALTEPKPSPLRRIAEAHGMPVLAHDPLVGGRYSALSNVGLLPAAIAGLDIRTIRDGAKAALDASLNVNAMQSPAVLGAALNIGLGNTRGIGASVLMPYQDVLQPFSFWFRQLWAESLGKEGNGSLPVNALGTVDQHSQLQLYLAGPSDKLFTLILADGTGAGPNVAESMDAEIDYLSGKRLGDLLVAEQRATAEILIKNGRPTRILRIAQSDERSIGALMAHYMLETILAARLLKVDPFDQPAVEEGKELARAYLSAEQGR